LIDSHNSTLNNDSLEKGGGGFTNIEDLGSLDINDSETLKKDKFKSKKFHKILKFNEDNQEVMPKKRSPRYYNS
jgi:hypothetical protein